MDQDETTQSPVLDLTFGPMPAPEIGWNEIDGTFWMTWHGDNHIDIKLKDRDALRVLIRSALDAAAKSEPGIAHD